MEQNPDLIASNNGLGFLSDDNGHTYNRCHCMFRQLSSPRCLLIARSLEQFRDSRSRFMARRTVYEIL